MSEQLTDPERLGGDWHKLFPDHYEAAVAEAAGALAGYHMGHGEDGPMWTATFHGAFRAAIEEAFCWGFTAGRTGLLVTPSTPDGPRCTAEWPSDCTTAGCQIDAPACHLDATGEVHSGG